jgi:hypothetical protein
MLAITCREISAREFKPWTWNISELTKVNPWMNQPFVMPTWKQKISVEKVFEFFSLYFAILLFMGRVIVPKTIHSLLWGSLNLKVVCESQLFFFRFFSWNDIQKQSLLNFFSFLFNFCALNSLNFNGISSGNFCEGRLKI